MNMYTRVSAKGQVVLPKGLRDGKNWPAGTDLEVVDAGDGVLLRPRFPAKRGLTVDQAIARLRDIYTHHGPPVPVDKLGWRAEDDDGR